MPDLVEVNIRWRGEGKNVQVAGEFSNWETKDLQKKEDGSWMIKLNLSPGKYMYKFVVDNEWMVNQDMPTANDDQGNKNNLLEVEDGENSGDSDSWEKVSIPETDSNGETNGSGLQKIAVVERVFSLSCSFNDGLKYLEENGELIEKVTFSDAYYDTEDYLMLRKGIWLRKRQKEGSESWQLRTVLDQKLKICDDLEEITTCIRDTCEDTGNIVDIVKRRMHVMTKSEGMQSKWRVGETEVEMRKEGEVETAMIRVVGDIVAALKDLEKTATKLQLVTFQMPNLTKKLSGPA